MRSAYTKAEPNIAQQFCVLHFIDDVKDHELQQTETWTLQGAEIGDHLRKVEIAKNVNRQQRNVH